MTDPTPEATGLSAAEAAVYDRQMRLWGVDAQRRLQSAHVLVSGLSALGSELVKNLVLSGMSVTLHDTVDVAEEAVATQFFLDEADIGQNRAQACLAKVQELNPLVKVQVDTTSLDQHPTAFFQQFTVVCIVGASIDTELRLDAICREAGVAFFAGHSFGLEGVVFVDLGQKHTYRRTPMTNAPSTEQVQLAPVAVEFPSLAEALAVTWGSLKSSRKRGPQLPTIYVKLQLLQLYAKHNGDAADGDAFVAFSQQELERQGLPTDLFSVDDLRSLLCVADVDIVPVCAILAGILGQEVIKAISQKDEPVCNFFCFDGGVGTVRHIG